ncbi:MAG: prkC 34 [Acidobacteria bacterium]|nr:prkC 34 [Acidobacteriota bacterium]
MKASVLLHVALAAVMFAVGCAVAVWLVLWASLHSSVVRVPELRGLEITGAIAVVQEAGLIVRVQEGVFAPDIDVGHVARQRPAPGAQLKRGGTVLLSPSLGEAANRVPDLARLPASVAEAQIDEAGLRAGWRSQVEGEADAALVVAQSPVADSAVAPSSEVAVLVNRGPRERRFVAPDFTGAREEDAARVLRALGFRLAAVQRVVYPGVRPGVVLRQDPPAGGPVAEAAVVALWVSR